MNSKYSHKVNTVMVVVVVMVVVGGTGVQLFCFSETEFLLCYPDRLLS